ncbi:phosphoribosylanthranilate isomerase [Bacillus sp. B-jedd]|uniref:phosphoribosylanthranilate isomerase n=1 Tax=Bacillus sp. B-jedd TaxID=1476857 RepID=UPI000515544B|nr:phosphoribosylanthranilate isomerase [Bacillus sp. B-jedd]CEG27499.1 N-(5'-phosphoribosyl)anthranilate isomerase [Bacillus sp. B-jedd]
MKVKICGILDAETALYAIEQGADALGFVFAQSKRRICPDTAKNIIELLPKHIQKVGVFVNEPKKNIEKIAHYSGLTHLQLHGDETPVFCRSFSYPVIKAFNIGSDEDLLKIKDYECESYLLDSPRTKSRGGTGMTFDWTILSSGKIESGKIILAGGLDSENVGMAINLVNPYMVDVSSGVETDGIKDHDKIRKFIQIAKQSGGSKYANI